MLGQPELVPIAIGTEPHNQAVRLYGIYLFVGCCTDSYRYKFSMTFLLANF